MTWEISTLRDLLGATVPKPLSLGRRPRPKSTKVEDYDAGKGTQSVAKLQVQNFMDATFDLMTAALRSGGLFAALTVLNRRVAQRWTGLYRLTADRHLVNVALVDKLGEVCPSDLLSVPYDVSFCQFTLAQGHFRTDNSALDDRLTGHPYKGVINSYHAVPVVNAGGKVRGTLCHFDTDAMPLLDEDFELLRLAARTLPLELPRQSLLDACTTERSTGATSMVHR